MYKRQALDHADCCAHPGCNALLHIDVAPVGVIESSHIRVMRVADNMRNVAVTEGDKVEAQLKFGWEVDTYPVNEIAEAVAAVSESDTNALVDEYYDKYDIL